MAAREPTADQQPGSPADQQPGRAAAGPARQPAGLACTGLERAGEKKPPGDSRCGLNPPARGATLRT
jgi:hypothetical protein